MFRRLTNRLMSFARSRHAWAWLFLYAILESFLLPVPPDIFIIALSAARPKNAQRYAALTMAGSVLGGLVGYAIGRYGFSLIAEPVLAWACQYDDGLCPKSFLPKLHDLFDTYGIGVVAVSAMSPIIPYRLVILVAGMAKMPLLPFIAVSIVCHWARYAAVAFLTAEYGERALQIVNKRLRYILAGAVAIGLVIWGVAAYF